MARFLWTTEMDEALSALWSKKKTGSQVAAILGRKHGRVFSRSSVMGRINRLNLQRKNGSDKLHAEPSVGETHARKLNIANGRISNPRRNKPVKIIKPQVITPMIESNKNCTYIHGEARERNFCPNRAIFNKRSTSGAVSWCAEHVAIVYQPEKALSRDRIASLSVPSQRGRQAAR